MSHIRALLCLGLFGWLGYAVLTDSFPGSDGGSSKTRALKTFVDSATEQYGVLETATGLFTIGVALAFIMIMLGRRQS